jgi:apolipoprotein D and lipocalin family protein
VSQKNRALSGTLDVKNRIDYGAFVKYVLFMNFKIYIFISCFLLSQIASHQAWSAGPSGPGPAAVTEFDASRYQGFWYEIGSIPQSFQKGCQCTRAHYSIVSDGRLAVVNECRKGSVEAPKTFANGVARFRGASDIGDLEVSFFLWFYGSYRIIALDKQNYSWSVVSNDRAKTLWILSRQPQMSPSQIDSLLAVARQQGVDTSKFQMQIQDNCW